MTRRGETVSSVVFGGIEVFLTTSSSLSSLLFILSRLSWVSSAPRLSDLKPARQSPASWPPPADRAFPCPGRSPVEQPQHGDPRWRATAAVTRGDVGPAGAGSSTGGGVSCAHSPALQLGRRGTQRFLMDPPPPLRWSKTRQDC